MNTDDQQILAILQDCSDDMLRKYISNDSDCDVLIKTLESYQSLASDRQYLESTNRALAESNLNLQPKLEAAKAKLAADIEEFERAKSEYTALRDTYEAQNTGGESNLSIAGVLSTLQARAQRAEEDTDQQADEFFSSSTSGTYTDDDLNVFQKQFLESRTQAHLVKIKAEKLKELSANLNRWLITFFLIDSYDYVYIII